MNFIFDPYLVLYLPLYELDGASFMSKDAYGHLCTVIGALWRPNGRYFDGIDDRIDLGIALLGNANTLEIWARRFDATDTDQALVGQFRGGSYWETWGMGLYFDGGFIKLESVRISVKSATGFAPNRPPPRPNRPPLAG